MPSKIPCHCDGARLEIKQEKAEHMAIWEVRFISREKTTRPLNTIINTLLLPWRLEIEREKVEFMPMWAIPIAV